MDMLHELLAQRLGKMMVQYMDGQALNYEKLIGEQAVLVLNEVGNVLRRDGTSDFEIVDEIVSIFINYNLDSGNCHDFA